MKVLPIIRCSLIRGGAAGDADNGSSVAHSHKATQEKGRGTAKRTLAQKFFPLSTSLNERIVVKV